MRILFSLIALSLNLAAAERKPNVIVIVGDDMGYGDIGMHGSKEIPTPHIDSIAKNGVRCSSGYVSGPYCSPTRAGLLTGRYQTRFGHEFNPGGGGDNEKGLSLSETTMADRMKAAGYHTALVGKWHLGSGDKQHPLARGFDSFFGFIGGAHAYVPQPNVAPILRGREAVKEEEYLTDAFRREAVAVIDKHKSEPFFLYLAFNAVHTPMRATEKYLNRFADVNPEKRKTYCAMMAAMDDAIGGVLKKLDDEKLTENTLIFFFSDNGGPAANASQNGPLNGHKATTWEGGIRVPFLVQWKGKLPAGKVYDLPVIQLDVLPTALAAAGVSVKPEWKLDGVDLVPHLTEVKSAAPHDALYWRFGGQVAIRKGDWKLSKAAGMPKVVRDGRATLAAAQLFNLKDDLGEKTDVAVKHAEVVAELGSMWEKWNAGNVAALWPAPATQRKN